MTLLMGVNPTDVMLPRVTSRTAPLSSAQEPLWYFSRLAPGNPVYNEAVAIRKDGPFDVDAFRLAFNGIVRRHEIWHSTFEIVDGEPMQVVLQPPTFELPMLDLSGMSRSDAEVGAAAMAAEDAMPPYALDRGPLIRPRLVRFAGDHHRLYLAMHHLVFDGFSLRRVVLPELINLYNAYVSGESSPQLDPPFQYPDYAQWEREHANDSGKIEYWRGSLSGAPTLQFTKSPTSWYI